MNDEFRAQFPVTQHSIYLNHAAVSPPPISTIQAIESQLRDVSTNGSVNYRSWLAVKEAARQKLASLLGARPEQLAFVRNTSDGLSTVANGMAWRTGDNIVTFRNEFPSNVYPWLRLKNNLGIELRICEEHDGRINIEEILSLVDKQTRVIAISHVQYASGFQIDLARLGKAARRHDALLVVDVIQSLGVIPIDVEAELVDVAAGAGHKWLLTPEGVGFLYLSDRARERIEPTLVGWTSVPNPEDYNNFSQGWNKGTLAWESGTAPTSLFYGLKASLDLLTTIGISNISEYLANLTDHFCRSLDGSSYHVASSRTKSEKSQIVCIQNTRGLTPMSLFQNLRKQNIIAAPRGNRLRIAPHAYNTIQEIDELTHALFGLSGR
ncbi:MAG TPA: aminotransferase class V-fold PLP-dependent enzyme [Pyrinomonadaceae bacterium]